MFSILPLLPLWRFLIGTGYPLVASVRTIRQPITESSKQWLSYWAVYSLYTFVSNYVFWGFLSDFVPLYGEAELLFLAWLVHPEFLGARWVWSRVEKQ